MLILSAAILGVALILTGIVFMNALAFALLFWATKKASFDKISLATASAAWAVFWYLRQI